MYHIAIRMDWYRVLAFKRRALLPFFRLCFIRRLTTYDRLPLQRSKEIKQNGTLLMEHPKNQPDSLKLSERSVCELRSLGLTLD